MKAYKEYLAEVDCFTKAGVVCGQARKVAIQTASEALRFLGDKFACDGRFLANNYPRAVFLIDRNTDAVAECLLWFAVGTEVPQ